MPCLVIKDRAVVDEIRKSLALLHYKIRVTLCRMQRRDIVVSAT